MQPPSIDASLVRFTLPNNRISLLLEADDCLNEIHYCPPGSRRLMRWTWSHGHRSRCGGRVFPGYSRTPCSARACGIHGPTLPNRSWAPRRVSTRMTAHGWSSWNNRGPSVVRWGGRRFLRVICPMTCPLMLEWRVRASNCDPWLQAERPLNHTFPTSVSQSPQVLTSVCWLRSVQLQEAPYPSISGLLVFAC